MQTQLDRFSGIYLNEFSVPHAQEMPFKSGVVFGLSATAGPDMLEQTATFVQQADRPTVFSVSSPGAMVRLKELLAKHHLHVQEIKRISADVPALGIIIAPFERGFQTPAFNLITETDIFGERLIRSVKKKKNSQFLNDLSVLSAGDYVVHQSHGIGRFLGLKR